MVTCNVYPPVGDSTGEVHSLKLSPNLRKQTREVKLALATKDPLTNTAGGTHF